MIPQEETQVNSIENTSPQMTPDEAAAALAFATNLSNQLLPKAQPEASQTPTNATGGVPKEKDEVEPVKEPEVEQEEMATEEDIESVKEEISALREEIQKALKEDNAGQETT